MTTDSISATHRALHEQRAARSRRTFAPGESVVVCNGGVKGKVVAMETNAAGTWVRVDLGTGASKMFDPARVEVMG